MPMKDLSNLLWCVVLPRVHLCLHTCLHQNNLFVFSQAKLQQHAKAVELLQELHPVLDDDDEEFVTKLWRLLAYEMLVLSTAGQ